jgi:hypothetical protein
MKRYLLIPALLLTGALIGAAKAEPHVISEKMPAGPAQPEAFTLLAGPHTIDCDAIAVKSTGTVQMSCDIEELAAGNYPLTVVTRKPSNGTETRKAYGTLKVSLRYGCRTYQGQRLCNTSYQVVP